MSFLDLVVLAYVANGCRRGYRRRLEGELPSVISWAIFLVTGTGLYRWTDKLLEHVGKLTGQTFGVVSFIGMWVAAVVLVGKLHGVIHGWAEHRFDETVRRRWGVVAGGVRTALLASIALLVLAHWPLHGLTRGFVEDSVVGRGLIRVVLPVYGKTHGAL